MQFLEKYSSIIELELSQLKLPSNPSNLYDPVRYFLGLGGKRIRPILTLMASEHFGGSIENAIPAAISVELFHNFTLVHDDIMDEAPSRRNQPTVHQKWNQNIGILSGDLLLIKSYEQLQSYSPEIQSELLQLLNKTAVEVCEGQQMDMDFEKLNKISIADYLEMIRLKTSVLLGAALGIGAIVEKRRKQEIDSLYQFGVNLGIAFQIQDDILDLYGDTEKVGKIKGGDILNKKKSILSLMALDKGFQWQELDDFLNKDEKIKYVLHRFNELNIIDEARSLMNMYGEKAILILNEELNSEASNFKDLTSYLLNREN